MAHWSGIGIPKTNAIALEVSYTHTKKILLFFITYESLKILLKIKLNPIIVLLVMNEDKIFFLLVVDMVNGTTFAVVFKSP